MPPEARDHEQRVALDGGDDGLAVVRRVIPGAPSWLLAGRPRTGRERRSASPRWSRGSAPAT